MRRCTVYVLIITVLIALHAPLRAIGQSSVSSKVRTASNPSPISIELSGVEPPQDAPSQLSLVLDYGGHGGGPTDPQPMYWAATPGDFALDSAFFACGYQSRTSPKATLTYPDGRTTTLQGTSVSNECDSGQGWKYKVGFEPGVQLGQYRISLDHAEGQLSHQWIVDYPYCRTSLSLSAAKNHQREYLVGFDPNQNLTVLFYRPQGDPVDYQPDTLESRGLLDSKLLNYEHVAARPVVTDAEGTLILDIFTTRSSSLSLPLQYVVVGSQNVLLYSTLHSEADFLSAQSIPFKLAYRQPRYPTYQITLSDFGNIPNCPGVTRRFAQVDPRDDNPLPLYVAFNDTSHPTGSLTPGHPIEILERKLVWHDERTNVWYRLRTEDKREGWAYGPNLTPITPVLASGSIAEIVEILKNPVYLRETPDSIKGHKIEQLAPGTLVTTITKDFVEESHWWFVKTSKGQLGWIGASYLRSIGPWEPASLDRVPIPTRQPSQTPSPNVVSTVQVRCPKSPPPRLEIGQQVRVTPGDPNTLRSSPSGAKIVSIPGGSVIAVLDGPQCGTSGHTFWKVDYQGRIGWTAEGEGNVYWLEPIP